MKKIADGKETEPGGHAEAVIDEKTAKEATCTEEGYTGDKICPTCKKVLEHGENNSGQWTYSQKSFVRLGKQAVI